VLALAGAFGGNSRGYLAEIQVAAVPAVVASVVLLPKRPRPLLRQRVARSAYGRPPPRSAYGGSRGCRSGPRRITRPDPPNTAFCAVTQDETQRGTTVTPKPMLLHRQHLSRGRRPCRVTANGASPRRAEPCMACHSSATASAKRGLRPPSSLPPTAPPRAERARAAHQPRQGSLPLLRSRA
jgi:hypothetical protein